MTCIYFHRFPAFSFACFAEPLSLGSAPDINKKKTARATRFLQAGRLDFGLLTTLFVCLPWKNTTVEQILHIVTSLVVQIVDVISSTKWVELNNLIEKLSYRKLYSS